MLAGYVHGGGGGCTTCTLRGMFAGYVRRVEERGGAERTGVLPEAGELEAARRREATALLAQQVQPARVAVCALAVRVVCLRRMDAGEARFG